MRGREGERKNIETRREGNKDRLGERGKDKGIKREKKSEKRRKK